MTPAELTEARESLHLSQAALARLLGVHPNIVNRWERGHAKIPPYLPLAIRGLDHDQWRKLAVRADSMLSLLRYRGGIQWTETLPSQSEVDQVIGALRNVYDG